MTYYYALVIVKFFIGFTIVITHMNLSGKTQLSQMTPIDFIGNFVLGELLVELFIVTVSHYINILSYCLLV